MTFTLSQVLHNASCVPQGINEKNCALVEWLHFRKGVKVSLAEFGVISEEELASS